jgi:two-component system LytT family response regulator
MNLGAGLGSRGRPACCFLEYHPRRAGGLKIGTLSKFAVTSRTAKEAIEKVIELKPDIAIVDINMPVMNGIQTAQEIRRISPATKIVFLTIHDEPSTMLATRLRAHAFVPKSAAGTDLIPTLNRLAGTSSDGSIKSRRAAT